MRALLGILLIYGAICTFLLALGTGIGFLLHWILPSVDLGIGMLIGVITIGFAAQLFARISSLPLDDPLDDATFAEPFTPQRITYLIDPPPSRRRKRKQSGTQ
jgi:hypothetical protein